MSDDLTNDQIALLCEIGERKRVADDGDKQHDLRRLLTGGYVARNEGESRPALELTAKAIEFLGQRGAGLNEA